MLDPRTVRRLDHALATEQSEHRLPSVVAGLVRGGALVWSGAAGSPSGRADGPPADVGTQYRIGSLTKTLIAVEVMRLRDEGRLDVLDTVRDHLPEAATTEFAGVRIAELLAHTSGLQAETNGDWWERVAGGTWEELLALRPRLVNRPGARFHYSNVGYAVLGRLVSRLRGVPWDEAIRTGLLDPLGMTRTTTRPQQPAAPGWGVHPLADLLHVEPEHDGGAMAPAGQLWSTVEDLARWARFLAGETAGLLDPATLDEMCLPVAVNDIGGQAWEGGQGLGLQLWNLAGVRYAGHGGSMPGFLASIRVDRGTGDGVVVMANATSGMGPVTTTLLDLLRDEEPLPPKPWSADATQTSALDLVGDWYWGTTAYTLRAAPDGHFVLGAPGQQRGSRLRPAGDGWVGLDGYFEQERLTVVRTAHGAVSHLDLGSFRLTRTPYDPDADVPGGVDAARWH